MKGKAAKKLISDDESDISEADFEVKKKKAATKPVVKTEKVVKPAFPKKVVKKEVKVEAAPIDALNGSL